MLPGLKGVGVDGIDDVAAARVTPALLDQAARKVHPFGQTVKAWVAGLTPRLTVKVVQTGTNVDKASLQPTALLAIHVEEVALTHRSVLLVPAAAAAAPGRVQPVNSLTQARLDAFLRRVATDSGTGGGGGGAAAVSPSAAEHATPPPASTGRHHEYSLFVTQQLPPPSGGLLLARHHVRRPCTVHVTVACPNMPAPLPPVTVHLVHDHVHGMDTAVSMDPFYGFAPIRRVDGVAKAVAVDGGRGGPSPPRSHPPADSTSGKRATRETAVPPPAAPALTHRVPSDAELDIPDWAFDVDAPSRSPRGATPADGEDQSAAGADGDEASRVVAHGGGDLAAGEELDLLDWSDLADSSLLRDLELVVGKPLTSAVAAPAPSAATDTSTTAAAAKALASASPVWASDSTARAIVATPCHPIAAAAATVGGKPPAASDAAPLRTSPARRQPSVPAATAATATATGATHLRPAAAEPPRMAPVSATSSPPRSHSAAQPAVTVGGKRPRSEMAAALPAAADDGSPAEETQFLRSGAPSAAGSPLRRLPAQAPVVAGPLRVSVTPLPSPPPARPPLAPAVPPAAAHTTSAAVRAVARPPPASKAIGLDLDWMAEAPVAPAPAPLRSHGAPAGVPTAWVGMASTAASPDAAMLSSANGAPPGPPRASVDALLKSWGDFGARPYVPAVAGAGAVAAAGLPHGGSTWTSVRPSPPAWPPGVHHRDLTTAAGPLHAIGEWPAAAAPATIMDAAMSFGGGNTAAPTGHLSRLRGGHVVRPSLAARPTATLATTPAPSRHMAGAAAAMARVVRPTLQLTPPRGGASEDESMRAVGPPAPSSWPPPPRRDALFSSAAVSRAPSTTATPIKRLNFDAATSAAAAPSAPPPSALPPPPSSADGWFWPADSDAGHGGAAWGGGRGW
jgi:hypothetical protein